jgi:hypothetical protein
MRTRILALSIPLVLMVVALFAPIAHAARTELPTIAIDLAHGQQVNGVCAMMSVMPDAYWVIIVPDKASIDQLDNCIKTKAYAILTGGLTALTKSEISIDGLIIGQPVTPLSEDEKKAVLDWLKGDGSMLWCATDSDYPALGGNQELAQHICNDLLDYLAENGIPVHLRSDYVSVEDPVSNTGRSYRVVGLVKPPAKYNADLIALGAEKVLMHGPGAVMWVDENGDCHKIVDPATGKVASGTPDAIIPIVVTTENGNIVEHQPRNPGEPGEFGCAHQVGEQGVFVMLAAELVKVGEATKTIIVSGESPYYGYQSMLTFKYHGVMLDGPRFFRNLMLWSLGYLDELKALKQIEDAAAKQAEQAVAQQVNTVKSEVENVVNNKVATLEQKVSNLEQKVTSVGNNVNNLVKKVNDIDNQVKSLAGKIQEIENVKNIANSANNKASSAYWYGIGGLVLAIIALIAAGLAISKK